MIQLIPPSLTVYIASITKENKKYIEPPRYDNSNRSILCGLSEGFAVGYFQHIYCTRTLKTQEIRRQ